MYSRHRPMASPPRRLASVLCHLLPSAAPAATTTALAEPLTLTASLTTPSTGVGRGYIRGNVDFRKYARDGSESDLVGLHPSELDTPLLTVDLAVLEKNISDMQSECAALGVGVRAHFKAHKMPHLARMQVAAGATMACQKIGEAEVLLDAIPDA